MAESNTTYQFMSPQTGTGHAAGSSTTMSAHTSTYLEGSSPDSIGSEALSIALIGPDEQRRKEAATALLLCDGTEVREYSAYPASLDEVPRLLEQQMTSSSSTSTAIRSMHWNWWRASAPTAQPQ